MRIVFLIDEKGGKFKNKRAKKLKVARFVRMNFLSYFVMICVILGLITVLVPRILGTPEPVDT